MDMLTDEEKTRVIILTAHYRILGEIALLQDARMTDYILNSNDFIAVVNAEVMDRSGLLILSTSFLNVQKQRIEAIMPADLVTMGGK